MPRGPALAGPPSPGVVGAPGGLPAEAVRGPPSRYALRWTAFACTQSEGWAHFELTRINIDELTILPKKIEDLPVLRASILFPRALHQDANDFRVTFERYLRRYTTVTSVSDGSGVGSP